MAQERISGAVGAAVTPLRDDGERLDLDAFEPLLELYGASGLDGLLVLGTTGEGMLLEDGERRRVAELAASGLEALRLIVHCGAQTTAQTCALAAHAAEAGADAVAVIGPPYFPFTARELVAHFVAAAAACAPLPFYIYEYAERSGYAVPVAVVEDVGGRAPNLMGMKVSDVPWSRVEPYLGTGLDIFIGAESLICEGLEHGAAGAVSGVAAAFPEEVLALVRDPTPDRVALLRSLRRALSEHPFQPSVKVALRSRGVRVRPDVRAPLLPLPPEAADRLRGELERLLGAEVFAGRARA
ncbi:MAG: dihydrodipicolinate synthase family protein [Solirubrobacterales bacterium]|nr:dihydrodipicolinate synthase family protein [Solirubrobacterales bacterium]MBV9536747.1 dihydrodipicolinate synthase family protein [Solirubrobacterales bacterium]